jgi:hypothetical protein
VIDLAVGGTDGWFRDGVANKPWIDTSPTASRDFWWASDTWKDTWKKQGWLQVRSVKMWQQGGYKGCPVKAKKG